jgi:hypothetical protein
VRIRRTILRPPRVEREKPESTMIRTCSDTPALRRRRWRRLARPVERVELPPLAHVEPPLRAPELSQVPAARVGVGRAALRRCAGDCRLCLATRCRVLRRRAARMGTRARGSGGRGGVVVKWRTSSVTISDNTVQDKVCGHDTRAWQVQGVRRDIRLRNDSRYEWRRSLPACSWTAIATSST